VTGFPTTDPAQASRTARVIVIAMIAGLTARLFFGLGYWVNKPLTHDEHEYLALARSLETGNGFRYPDPLPPALASQQFSRAPGYPLFLAIVGGEEGLAADVSSSPRSVKVAQAVVGAFGVLLVGLLAWRTAGATAGAVGASIAAIYPPLVWMPGYVLSETLFSVLMLTTVLLMTWIDGESGQNRWQTRTLTAICGGLAGLAALTRPMMLVFIGLAGCWGLVRNRWQFAAVFVLGALLVIAPWTLRNMSEHERLVVVAANGGLNFWIGNHPLSSGDGDLAANPDVALSNLAFRQAHAGLTAAELEPLYYGEALRYVLLHPVWWMGLLLRKLFFLFIPVGPSYMLHASTYFWASVVSYGLLLPIGVAGAIALGRKVPAGVCLMALSTVLTSLVFFPQERFRIPVLDPTLIILGAAWLATGRRVLAAPSAASPDHLAP